MHNALMGSVQNEKRNIVAEVNYCYHRITAHNGESSVSRENCARNGGGCATLARNAP